MIDDRNIDQKKLVDLFMACQFLLSTKKISTKYNLRIFKVLEKQDAKI